MVLEKLNNVLHQLIKAFGWIFIGIPRRFLFRSSRHKGDKKPTYRLEGKEKEGRKERRRHQPPLPLCDRRAGLIKLPQVYNLSSVQRSFPLYFLCVFIKKKLRPVSCRRCHLIIKLAIGSYAHKRQLVEQSPEYRSIYCVCINQKRVAEKGNRLVCCAGDHQCLADIIDPVQPLIKHTQILNSIHEYGIPTQNGNPHRFNDPQQRHRPRAATDLHKDWLSYIHG